jgi:hypothetical protein
VQFRGQRPLLQRLGLGGRKGYGGGRLPTGGANGKKKDEKR